MRGKSPRAHRNAWASAKARLLDCWDNPPAVVLWLLLIVITIAGLKGLGL